MATWLLKKVQKEFIGGKQSLHQMTLDLLDIHMFPSAQSGGGGRENFELFIIYNN